MVKWIIAGCVALFFLLLFTVHAQVTIDLKDELSLTVKVLGIPIRILPNKKQKKYKLSHYTLKKIRKREVKAAKKQAKADAAKAKKAAAKARKKAEDAQLSKAEKKAIKKRQKAERPKITDMISLIARVAKLFFSHFFGKLHIKVARIRVTVGGGDAAQIALMYGIVTHAVGGLTALLRRICQLEGMDKADVWVAPDFTKEKIEFDLCLTFRLSLGNVLWAVLKAGFAFLFGYIKIKPDVPDSEAHKVKNSEKRLLEKQRQPANTEDASIESTHMGHIPLPPNPPKPPKPW